MCVSEMRVRVRERERDRESEGERGRESTPSVEFLGNICPFVAEPSMCLGVSVSV